MFNLSQNNLLRMNDEDIEKHLIKDRVNFEEKLSKLMIFKGSKIFDSFINHYESLINIQLKERELFKEKTEISLNDKNVPSLNMH